MERITFVKVRLSRDVMMRAIFKRLVCMQKWTFHAKT